MWFALTFTAGTALCQYLLPPPWPAYAGTAAAGAGILLAFGWKSRRGLVLCLALGLCAGLLWYSFYGKAYLTPGEALAASTAQERAAVTLELLDYPEASDSGSRCVVRAVNGEFRGKGMYYGGDSLLALEPGNQVAASAKYYSAVSLSGEESSYYTSQGIFVRLYGKDETVTEGRAGSLRFLPQRMAFALRRWVEGSFPSQSAGLILGLLTGDRECLDEQSRTDLQEAGLMHITAVSGLHCGFLIGLLGILLGRRQRLTLLVGYPALLFYALLAGGKPSVVRSCVMVGFLLLAPLVGRESDPLTALGEAALVILLANPFAVASVSFQLSFASVVGLLAMSPRLYGVLGGGREWKCPLAGWVWRFAVGSLSASLGVFIATAPLSALYFGCLSLVSPLANLLVLWVVPVLFAVALTAALLLPLLPGLYVLAAAADLLARYVLLTAHWLAGLPGHGVYFIQRRAWIWLAVAYAGFLLVLALRRGHRWRFAAAAVTIAAILILSRFLPRQPLLDGCFTIAAVDVGQGAATLLYDHGAVALVDCGSLYCPRGAGGAVADAMYTYGWDRLEYVALTHYHEDHAGGLAGLLARVEVETFLLPQLAGSEDQAALQGEVLALAARYGVEVRFVEEFTELPLGEAALRLYPPLGAGDANEEGLSVLCSSGEFDVLITGDMADSTERKLLAAYDLPDIEVLMVGHHGSKYATSEELLDAVTPEAAVISVGENTYGHPTPETLARLEERGIPVYRTDERGTVLLRPQPQP